MCQNQCQAEVKLSRVKGRRSKCHVSKGGGQTLTCQKQSDVEVKVSRVKSSFRRRTESHAPKAVWCQ